MANSTGEEAAGECIDDVEGAEIDEDEEKMKSSMGPNIPRQGSSAGLDSQFYTVDSLLTDTLYTRYSLKSDAILDFLGWFAVKSRIYPIPGTRYLFRGKNR